MGFIIGFAPWIVYWILVGNTGFVAAVAIANNPKLLTG